MARRGRERGLECLLETAGPHAELKQEIPASGGRGGFGAAKRRADKEALLERDIKKSLKKNRCLCVGGSCVSSVVCARGCVFVRGGSPTAGS